MNTEQNGFVNFSEGGKLLPQEEILDFNAKHSNLTIGVPREMSYQESRIPLVPQSVGLLVANGHKVKIESNAGKAAQFSDHEFSEVGGEIVYSAEEVYKSDIIIKVAPLSIKEIDLLKSHQTVFSSVHTSDRSREYFEKLMTKKMTMLGYEFIQDKTASYPIIRAMSEIAGTASIFIAAEYLANNEFGKGHLFGGFPGISPTEVVIIGSGTVAENAVKAALGLGAIVKIFDNSIYRLRRLQSAINSRVFTSIIQPKVLIKALRTADVVIGSVYSHEGMSPCIVTEEMVKQMKSGTVMIDVSIDQGGCFETSKITNHKDPVFKKYDVTHYCVPNIASKVPHTASYALSNFLTPVLLKVGDMGGIEGILKTDNGMLRGVYLFKGTLTKPHIGEYFTLPYQNIDLLIAALR